MPTWTVANGQDDIVWHQATINGRVASAKISSSEHNEEAGEYITHVLSIFQQRKGTDK